MSTWYCTQCGEEIEDTFEACWNCGTGEDGIVDYDFKPADPPGEDLENVIDVAPHSAQLKQALEYSQYNFGLGMILSVFIPFLFFSGGAIAMSFSRLTAQSENDWNVLALLFGGAALLCGWKLISTVRDTPMKIRIADRVTVRYLLCTREWESYQLRTIRFIQHVRFMWLIYLPIPVERYRLANLSLGEGEEVEFLVTPEQEAELRGLWLGRIRLMALPANFACRLAVV